MFYSDSDGVEGDMTDTADRNRRLLLGMFAIAFFTLGGAYLLFHMAQEAGVWGTTNNGEFVEPPKSVADLSIRDTGGVLLTEGRTWWLWVVSPEGCTDDACRSAVDRLRALHILLNKDADRLRRALVTRPGGKPAILADYPALAHLTGPLHGLQTGIYIVDPIGNLVLFYPMQDAGSPVLEDLKKLLKLSRIG